MQIFEPTVFENNAVFDFAVAHNAIIMTRGIGSNKGVFDDSALANDGGSANFGSDDARAFFQHDASLKNGSFDTALIFAFNHIQDQAVRFEHIADASGVHPRVGE